VDRDPRIDPQAGDVVVGCGGSIARRRVVTVTADAVVWTPERSPARPTYTKSLKSWRRWAAGGEVVARG
jgi:hypothetical protein